jgi:hypothetical protein
MSLSKNGAVPLLEAPTLCPLHGDIMWRHGTL